MRELLPNCASTETCYGLAMHLFAAVPTHSGMLVAETVRTLIGVQQLALNRGWAFSFHYTGGATISVVRNAMAAAFLESGADVLLMLDSDQAADPLTIERMIDLEQPVVGCIYPRRVLNWSNVKETGSLRQIFYQAMDFVGVLDADEAGCTSVADGFARAQHVGTGILVVRRAVFERLMAHFPDLRSLGFDQIGYPELSENWGFFNSTTAQNGFPLSEDISFCVRWREAGGEIWAEVSSSTTHVGRFKFEGSYLEYLNSRQPL